MFNKQCFIPLTFLFLRRSKVLWADCSSSSTLCLIDALGGRGVTKSFSNVVFFALGFCTVTDEIVVCFLSDLTTFVWGWVAGLGVGLLLCERRGVGGALGAFFALYSFKISGQSTRFSSGSQLSPFGPNFFHLILYSVAPLRVRSARIFST